MNTNKALANFWKNNKILILLVSCVIAVVAIFFIFYPQHVKNIALEYEKSAETSFNSIGTALEARAGILKNLVSATQAGSQHEKEVFTEVAKLRSGVSNDIEQKHYEEAYTGIEKAINIMVEAYPELKNNELYLNFMDTTTVEGRAVKSAQDAYINAKANYETYIRKGFHKLFLNLAGYTKKDFEELNIEVNNHKYQNDYDFMKGE